ncbi:anti-sigma factor family protein [Sinosporangium siamense]|uniref:Putative zinc-finger domain-containing protein n=1 Tax=Sinosporangium siamense TaxID=1367973 RepID=A0A919V7F1_9ACTN|nr:zf-HC2 domain-containing protein [Sinosporangium siamense]GII93393.1 hypothetical protein Ssi02_36240 [Sinosporangium siamense]
MMTCEEVRLSLGAHVLGALEPDEAVLVEAHLAECEACAAEFDELAGVSDLLARVGRVSEHDVAQVASPPAAVLERLLSARAARRRRSRALLSLAASVVLLAGGGAVWAVMGSQTSTQTASSDAPAVLSAPSSAEAYAHNRAQDAESEAATAPRDAENAQKAFTEPPGAGSGGPPETAEKSARGPQTAAATPAPLQERAADAAGVPGELVRSGRSGDVRVTVRASPTPRGADIAVSLAGVAAGERGRLIVVGADGKSETAGSWVVKNADKGVYQGATSITPESITRFEIHGADGLLVSVPR